MKKSLLFLFSLLTWLMCSVHASANTDCVGYDESFPDHYCECQNENIRIANISGLKDLHFSDSIWFRTSSSTFTKAGLTAYLFSESDVQVDIYQTCKTDKKLYSFLVPKNQTRDMDHQAILDKMEQYGGAGASMVIYVLFYPLEEGADCRLMCYPYNSGPNSTPEDILPVLVGMTFVSSHAYDVYQLTAEHIPASCALFTQWQETNNSPCHLTITRGSVDGEVIAEHDFIEPDDYYHFDSQLLAELRATGESLYMHYTHDASAAGRIITQEVFTADVLTDVHICQGQSWTFNGQTYSESTMVPYDTVWTSTITRDIYYYNLIVDAPELQYDTLALRHTELPHHYQGQYPITEYGDYNLMLQTPGECDQHIQLHVRHHLTTITTVLDTTLCQGKPYTAPDGKIYHYDVTLIDSTWLNLDTVYVHQTNVYFNAFDIVHDTMAVKMDDIPFRIHYTIIREFGDYKMLVYDENDCPDSLYLHVRHDQTIIRDTVEKILCEGTIYTHTDGTVYTTSTVIADTVQTNPDTQTVTVTVLQFVSNQLQYDTLYLRTTQLPYTYQGKTIATFGEHDLLFEYGECDQPMHLTVIHQIDTIYQSADTTLCQGIPYAHQGTLYTSDTVITQIDWTTPDTYQITTITVHFTAPEAQPDTLALKTTDLPYLYRGQETIANFGHYDLTISQDSLCDERYQLYVYHRIDTIYQIIDTILCQGKIYRYSESLQFTEDAHFVDTVDYNQDTCFINDVMVQFVELEAHYDTLYLKTTDLPYLYRQQYTIPQGGLNQAYDFTLHYEDACDEHYYLYVVHAIDTLRPIIDTILCQGIAFEHAGEYYTDNTTLLASEWLNPDTYQITTIHLHFAAPEAQRDTLALRTTDLPYVYHGQDTIYDFGNHDITLHTEGECDERYLVHVVHRVDSIYHVVDSTICYQYGTPSYEYEGKWYSTEKTFTQYTQYNPDTVIVDVLNVYFSAEPASVYDTLYLKATQLPYKYQLPDRKYLTIKSFGDYDKEYEDYYTWCVEHLYLHVSQRIDTIYQAIDTTLCQGKIFTHNAQSYTTDTTLVDAAMGNDGNYHITTLIVRFTAPEPVADTLALKTTDLPYLYRNQELIPAFGDYDITIHTLGQCDERYLVHVSHLVDTIFTSIDTTLCEGRIFTYNALEYTVDTALVDSTLWNEDMLEIQHIKVVFAAPEMEYDTLLLTTQQLLEGYYYLPADTMIYAAGEYFYVITTYDECTRHLTLTVNEEIGSSLESLPVTEQPRLIMLEGRVYILRGKDCFTLLGEKL